MLLDPQSRSYIQDLRTTDPREDESRTPRAGYCETPTSGSSNTPTSNNGAMINRAGYSGSRATPAKVRRCCYAVLSMK